MTQTILKVNHLKKEFNDSYRVKALDDVSLEVKEGEILGVVGESGSGKSTLAKVITRLQNADAGDVFLCGENITRLKGNTLRKCYRQMGMVFQDASGSFDQRLSIGKSIDEVLENFTDMNEKERTEETERLLEAVGLKKDYRKRRPSQLSGGECQRAAIARAISVKPKLLICDEATSALDVSMQAQIVELIKRLAEEMNMAVLFISHDLALVSSLCDRVAVMYHGSVVEQGEAYEVISSPKNEYTKQLRASAFCIET
ncbi:MAG: ABC transporter ATP-binding protein [Clostridia bacterium]|nr:dipeptide/oligopeptide/nickel ABC transporter ATP-binding protein [Lachnospiraceae bacterium]NCC00193.1 ABC transporter ATP-binding protein [Clostridia bacterium]NCD03295.1 ABC transporter ATP-binding protein [Clostridia bacterium]